MKKEDYIKSHIELWDWLAENPDKEKDDWPGWERFDFDESYLEELSYCFACMYDAEKGGDYCVNCLFEWPDNYRCEDSYDSPFVKWQNAKQNKTRTKYAKQVRDLPIRELSK